MRNSDLIATFKVFQVRFNDIVMFPPERRRGALTHIKSLSVDIRNHADALEATGIYEIENPPEKVLIYREIVEGYRILLANLRRLEDSCLERAN